MFRALSKQSALSRVERTRARTAETSQPEARAGTLGRYLAGRERVAFSRHRIKTAIEMQTDDLHTQLRQTSSRLMKAQDQETAALRPENIGVGLEGMRQRSRSSSENFG
jgi:hypothetical protein